MKNAIKTVLLTLTMSLAVQAQTIRTVKGFNHPESVVANGRSLYVADIGTALAPNAKDGDGKIVKLDSKGTIIDANFVKEMLNAPKGITVYKDILFFTDIDKLFAVDAATGAVLYQVDFAGATQYLNDIAVWDANTVYVSATDVGKLFKVNLSEKKYTEVVTDKPLAGINGLYCYPKSNKLYVNTSGSGDKGNGVVGYVNLKKNTFIQLTAIEGLYDGLTVVNDVLYVSNWVAMEKKGILLSVQLSDSRVNRVPVAELISGPADFIIDGNTIIVPAMLTGELHFIPFDNSVTPKF